MMEQALKTAGFLGVEAEDGVIYARLPAGEEAFRADHEDGQWRLSLAWALGASLAQQAQWTNAHPNAPMDLWQGETRVSYFIRATDPADVQNLLCQWQVVAEAAIAQMILWRRAQRAPGEGM